MSWTIISKTSKTTPVDTDAFPIAESVGTVKKIVLSNLVTYIASKITNMLGYLYVTSDGRVYGTALHNNAGAVTGTTNQYIASGTYTPSFTAVTNVSAAASQGTAIWIRVGNVVTVSGAFSLTLTTSGAAFEAGMSLPIAVASFASTSKANGTAASSALQAVIPSLADTSNLRAAWKGVGIASTSANYFSYTMTYLIS